MIDRQKTLLDRAFELASDRKHRTTVEIRETLRAEGHRDVYRQTTAGGVASALRARIRETWRTEGRKLSD